MAVESRPRGRWIEDRGFEGRRGQPLSGRRGFRLRFAAGRQPFGRALANKGILGAPGDAARQSPAAMAGARLSATALSFKTRAELFKKRRASRNFNFKR